MVNLSRRRRKTRKTKCCDLPETSCWKEDRCKRKHALLCCWISRWSATR